MLLSTTVVSARIHLPDSIFSFNAYSTITSWMESQVFSETAFTLRCNDRNPGTPQAI
jgi:hypothetical protein